MTYHTGAHCLKSILGIIIVTSVTYQHRCQFLVHLLLLSPEKIRQIKPNCGVEIRKYNVRRSSHGVVSWTCDPMLAIALGQKFDSHSWRLFCCNPLG